MVIFADWASQFDTRPGLAMLSGITTIKPSSLINFAQEESWLLIPVHPCRKTRTGSRSFTVTLSGLVGKNDPGTETVALVQAISSSVSSFFCLSRTSLSRSAAFSGLSLKCKPVLPDSNVTQRPLPRATPCPRAGPARYYWRGQRTSSFYRQVLDRIDPPPVVVPEGC